MSQNIKTVLVPQSYDVSSRQKLRYNYGLKPRKHGKVIPLFWT
ncbi:hypothetical protein D910_00907 [Dendroctonus ponderosae]|uniref:Uncharacterized protein n=1 Tax=Dendroctonus ponderosae TaxID=77166 RepID=U4USH0_DENPD|nr:hypothetical protein D910_00907 [Dendroctonus ponderosae]